MAVSLGNHDSEDIEQNGEINVTPFIDVMLVLLIIFMVAAPLSTVDVPVDLPAAVAQPQARPDKPVFITVKQDLTLTVGETPTNWNELGNDVEVATHLDHNARLFIRADKTVPYGDIMRVFNALRTAGYLKVALVGLEQSGAPAPAAGP